ncbi:uncharacterized protein C2orf72 isoform X1 [Acipenser ruthenus]|uniref:uncharacterized protein C2orf72 isoform X1 n=1 Tax=Acipenser ruthenus TaxID=7906 RepID=UPI00145BECE4|nr:uncharacterized protein C2orf72 isoform X1 [Acipenser ruthenus]
MGVGEEVERASRGSDSESQQDDDPTEEEFQQVLKDIGGRERIFLVSDVLEKGDGSETGSLEEFVNEMFPSGLNTTTGTSDDETCVAIKNGSISAGGGGDGSVIGNVNASNCAGIPGEEIQPGEKDEADPCSSDDASSSAAKPATGLVKCSQQKGGVETRRAYGKACKGTQRAIDCPLIVFVFRHEFLLHPRNRVCLKEILKDVRGRSRAAGVQPALLGLVHSRRESGDSWQSVRLLEQLLQRVFKGHPGEAMWAGHFIPKNPGCTLEIKRNACKAIRASLCTETGDSRDRGGTMSWVRKCFPWQARENRRRQPNCSSSTSRQGVQQSREEAVPLRISRPVAEPLNPSCIASEQETQA